MKHLLFFASAALFCLQLNAQQTIQMTIDGKLTYVFDSSRIDVQNNERNLFIGEDAGLSNTPAAGPSQGWFNTFLGHHAGWNNTTGNQNVFVGSGTGVANVTGRFNTFVGDEAGASNTGSENTYIGQNSGLGAGTTSVGEMNTFLGNYTGYLISAGSKNVLAGNAAGRNLTNGSENVLLGMDAGYFGTENAQLTGIGHQALRNNRNGATDSIHGTQNTAVGYQSLTNNTIGYENTATGYKSLTSNTTGLYNSAFGDLALTNNLTGTSNTALGNNAMLNNNSGNKNTAIGHQALNNNFNGHGNIAMGYGALYSSVTKSENVAVGDSALYFNGTGASAAEHSVSNVAIGPHALEKNTTGSYNNALGDRALQGNTTGISNTAMGHFALGQNQNGSHNTAIGEGALQGNTGGSNNTGIGDDALLYNTGSNNTAVGQGALSATTFPGSGNVALGYQAGAQETGSNRLYIDNSNTLIPLVYGEFDNNILRVNGEFQIGNAYKFPTVNGAFDQVLKADIGGQLTWQNDEVDDADSDPANELQSISVSGDSLYISNGNGVKLPKYMIDMDSDTKLELSEAGPSGDIIGITVDNIQIAGFDKKGLHFFNNNSNTFVGGSTGAAHATGTNNAMYGKEAGLNISSGSENTFIGSGAGASHSSGSQNTYIGNLAGSLTAAADGNVFIGYKAGNFIGGDNQLVIENSDSSTPLIYGDFSADSMDINGKLRINCTATQFDFVTTDYVGEPILRANSANFGYLGSTDHPLWRSYVHTYYASDLTKYLSYSDRSLKENIRPVADAIEKVMRLEPVQYDWKKEHFQKGRAAHNKIEMDRKNALGLIAQDVEQIFPELVKTDENSGLKAVGYQGFIPVLIRGMQEQQLTIERQAELIGKLTQRLDNLESKINNTSKEK